VIIGIQRDFPFLGVCWIISNLKTFSSTEGTGFKPVQITVVEPLKETADSAIEGELSLTFAKHAHSHNW
jgi:hypothetical protein